MSILDTILNDPDVRNGISKFAADNPDILKSAAKLLSSDNTSVGGSGGLAGLVSAFESSGLSELVSSWIGTGKNLPVSSEQVSQSLGEDKLRQFANDAGIEHHDAASALASLLPTLVNQLTPHGKSSEGSVEDLIGKLLS